MKVRQGTRADAASLARLRWHSRSEPERSAESFEGFAARFGTWLCAALESNQWTVVAGTSDGGRVVGCMYLQRVATVPVPGAPNRAWGYLTHAFVEPAHRRLGLGSRLLDAMVLTGRQMGLHELHVWPSSEAASLYLRAGFLDADTQVSTGEQDVPPFFLRLS